MVSVRYLDFKKFLYKFWRLIFRYYLIIFGMGLLIGYVFKALRNSLVFFIFLWAVIALAITYILFFAFYKPPKDMDGDF